MGRARSPVGRRTRADRVFVTGLDRFRAAAGLRGRFGHAGSSGTRPPVPRRQRVRSRPSALPSCLRPGPHGTRRGRLRQGSPSDPRGPPGFRCLLWTARRERALRAPGRPAVRCEGSGRRRRSPGKGGRGHAGPLGGRRGQDRGGPGVFPERPLKGPSQLLRETLDLAPGEGTGWRWRPGLGDLLGDPGRGTGEGGGHGRSGGGRHREDARTVGVPGREGDRSVGEIPEGRRGLRGTQDAAL